MGSYRGIAGILMNTVPVHTNVNIYLIRLKAWDSNLVVDNMGSNLLFLLLILLCTNSLQPAYHDWHVNIENFQVYPYLLIVS